MSNGKHPKVTRIMVAFDNGETRVYPDDVGYMPVALFWNGDDSNEDSGIDILGKYYKHVKKGHKMHFDKLKKNFGEGRAKKVCNPDEEIEITDDVIKTIWEAESDQSLLGIISKQPGCDSGG
jgi:hypothetical protein